MSRLQIASTSVEGLLADPGFAALLAEYQAEARSPEMPETVPRWEQYLALERAGQLTAIGAWDCGALIGFVSIIRSDIPHYVGQVCVAESLFVSVNGRRGTGAGRALIRAAEAIADEAGAPLLVTAPAGGALEVILPRHGYRHSNTVFVRSPA